VNFVPDYKILHDAGYNVLAYDLRNFGHSGAANGGIFSVGRYEARDVIGSLNYVRGRQDTHEMTIGLEPDARMVRQVHELTKHRYLSQAFPNPKQIGVAEPRYPLYVCAAM
jgi:alpha/beta superfamily hydrolase